VLAAYCVRRNTRAAQHACDMDARNKQHSQNIDERMHQLHNGSSGIGRYQGVETYDNTYVLRSLYLFIRISLFAVLIFFRTVRVHLPCNSFARNCRPRHHLQSEEWTDRCPTWYVPAPDRFAFIVYFNCAFEIGRSHS